MDPRFQYADSPYDNKSFSPVLDYNTKDQSDHNSRENTWSQTPAFVPFPPQFRFQTQSTYLPGPIDDNGYPMDVKEQEQGYGSNQQSEKTAVNSPRDSIDMEKQKAEIHVEPLDPHAKDPNQPRLSFGQRIKHFTWANYTLTMSTGGISTLIAVQPHQFPGLITIGAVFYVITLIFFVALCGLMIARFTKFPGSFKESIKHEREGFFFATFWLSLATIINGTQKYVVVMYEAQHPMRGWLTTSMAIAFWIYVFCTFSLAIFQFSFLFCAHTYPLHKMMPSWLLPIFPVMLAGTIASVIASDQPLAARMPILVAGLGCQGLGFTVAVLMYAHYVGRLMSAGYPNREHRGAMFIGVGPPSFTCLALIGMANALPADFELQGDGLLDGNMLRTLALVSALFLWVLAMWFFMIAAIAVSISLAILDYHLTNK
jgi:tellurite resistance protein TehA-like permease